MWHLQHHQYVHNKNSLHWHTDVSWCCCRGQTWARGALGGLLCTVVGVSIPCEDRCNDSPCCVEPFSTPGFERPLGGSNSRGDSVIFTPAHLHLTISSPFSNCLPLIPHSSSPPPASCFLPINPLLHPQPSLSRATPLRGQCVSVFLYDIYSDQKTPWSLQLTLQMLSSAPYWERGEHKKTKKKFCQKLNEEKTGVKPGQKREVTWSRRSWWIVIDN